MMWPIMTEMVRRQALEGPRPVLWSQTNPCLSVLSLAAAVYPPLWLQQAALSATLQLS